MYSQNTKNQVPNKEPAKSVTISPFGVQKDVKDFPNTSLSIMMAEIVEELQKTNRFSEVILGTDKETSAEKTESKEVDGGLKPTASKIEIRLEGLITKYDKGSRTARYMIPGAGQTKIVVKIKFTDANDKILLEKEISGNVSIGFFGGSSNGVTRSLAKEVAKTAKKLF